MRIRSRFSNSCLASLIVAVLMLSGVDCLAGVRASYLYKLSNFQGPVPSLWARVCVDREEGEVYVLNRSVSAIQIYNSSGMQTFSFGEDLNMVGAADIAAGEGGEIYVLVRRPFPRILHLDYRGTPLSEIKVNKVPEAFQPFQPDFLDQRGGHLYLADSSSMQAIVTTPQGTFERGFDLRKALLSPIKASLRDSDLGDGRKKALEKDIEQIEGADLTGFAAGEDGTLYLTSATLFSAYRVKPDGKLEGFGVSGGGPGKFGVVAGIGADIQGNIFVSDRLRCVVLVFDRALKFQTEFGYRGSRPENLVVPDDLALDERNGKLYVSQAADLGVSVFAVRFH